MSQLAALDADYVERHRNVLAERLESRQCDRQALSLDRLADEHQAQRTLANFTAVGRLGSGAAPESEEIFAGDIRDVVAGMITKILNEMGRTPGAMSREEKMEVVKRLEERGAFLVKRSAEQVAEALGARGQVLVF